MTRAEQEAFEKWFSDKFGDGKNKDWPINFLETKEIFISGYRAGFEAQHYDIEDVSKVKVE